MDVVLLLLFCGWVASVIVTRKTRAWWVPRLIPAILGILAFAQISDTHGDVGGLQAFANGVSMLAGLILLGISAVTIGLRLMRGGHGTSANGFPDPPPVPPTIPPAYVVTRGDRSLDE